MSDKEPKIKQQTLYAFWDYDICPYMLGGEVKEVRPNGRVVIKGYNGMSFKPIAILPDEAGLDALKKIKTYQQQCSYLEKAIKNVYKKEALKAIGRG
jgi:hypothetical protein